MNPTNTTIDMNTFLEMSTPDTGLFSASITQTKMNVGTSKGDFGYMMMPSVSVDSSQLWINMTSTLHITDVPLFTEATASVLQGHPDPWIIHGSPSFHLSLAGSTLTFPLSLSKTFDLPKTLFSQMQSSSITLLSSSPDRITSSATSTFFSSSVLEMRNVGSMTFNLSHPDTGVKMGEVTVPDFQAVRDFNKLDNCVVEMILTSQNLGILNEFLQLFMSGVDQTVMMIGPIRSAAPFLSDVVTQSVTIQGSNLVSHATASNMRITHTSSWAINATAMSSFYSDLVLTMDAVGGPQEMALLSANGIQIGSVMLSQDVHIGFNTFVSETSLHCNAAAEFNNVELVVVESDVTAMSKVFTEQQQTTRRAGQKDVAACERAIVEFLSSFSLGETQSLRFVGPINPVTPFMRNAINAEILIEGSKMMEDVSASNFAIVATNATHMWSSCDVTFASECPISMDAVGGFLIMQMETTEGIVLGHVYIEQDVKQGLNHVENVRTLMVNNNNSTTIAAVQNFLRVLGSGGTQISVLSGPVGGGSPLMYNTMRQNVTVKGSLMMSNVVADKIVTVGGSESELQSTSQTTFVSGMNVPRGATGGPLQFEMVGLRGVVIGFVSVDANVELGLNQVSSICVLTKNPANEASISAFLGNFLSATDQTISISGPTNTVIPFLDHIFETNCTIKAELDPMVYFAIVDKETLEGYSVKINDTKVAYRGSRVTLLNPFPVTIRVRNLISNMFLHQALAFDFTFLTKKHTCPLTIAFTQQLTAKGMYPDNIDQDYVELEPLTTTSFFSPSIPQPSQEGGDLCDVPLVVDLPCCYLATPIAASCRAKNVLAADHVELFSNGTYTLNISGFEMNVPFAQSNITVVFDEYVLSGFAGDGELGCSSIDIKA
eukprot:c8164_g1_i1.p1 GENE.c8164_g1_i1~~c8164_g1_i1.p1  ORF type:complete len:888 (+),score=245.29 c8164_g1_i1:1-2664(+)